MTVTPTISNTNVINVLGNAGTPWSVATITTSTITNPTNGYTANVENVFFQLTPSATSTYGGAIQADYLVGTNGALSPIDNIFYQANGATTAVYFGSEGLNPYFQATGFTPADAGYAYTIYNYANTGAISNVTAVMTNGQSFSSVGNTST